MLLVYSLLAAALLGASDVTTSQQALPQETPGSICERSNGATEQGAQEDSPAFIGVISEIDYSKGLVTIETDAGKLEAAVSSEDLAHLQEGNLLILCATEEAPGENPILQEPFIT